MSLRNTTDRYGLVAITLHWVIAVGIIGLFALGLWMMDLDYYDNWYQRGPWLHKGIGFTVFGLLLARLLWQSFNPRPVALTAPDDWQTKLAAAMHMTLNLTILLLSVSGYLIVTAKGDPLSVFGLFQIPAIIDSIENLEDRAGDLHRYLAYGIIALALLHALAAIKHHLINKDRTLLRMLGR